MAGRKDQELTLVVPGLSRKEGVALRDALIAEKKKVAPKAKATIQIGRKQNFPNIMRRCQKALEGD